MNKRLLIIASGLLISGLSACSRSLDQTVAPATSFAKVICVFQSDSTDFYSAKALFETDLAAENNWSTWGTPLFDKTEPVTYMLNNRRTANRESVKKIFIQHDIKEVLVGRENGRKIVSIRYEERRRLAPLRLKSL